MKKKDEAEKLRVVLNALDDKKALNMTAYDVAIQSGYTDYMVFATGTSSQHNKTLADSVVREVKTAGFNKSVVEGDKSGSWVLIDTGDVVVNIMLDNVRSYYDLESLWIDSDQIDAYSQLG